MSQFHLAKTVLFSLSLSLATVFAEMPKRIVSVGGAATEIVFALEGGDNVVAVDLSSTYPPEVRALPKVGYIRNISPEGVLSMQPDLVVTTESMGPPAAKAMMKRVEVPVIWLPEPDSVEALDDSLHAVAAKLGNEKAAAEIMEGVNAQITSAQETAATWSKKPRVLFLMQPPSDSRPGMVAGSDTRAQSLIELAGGENAAMGVKTYQPYSKESILETNPDVIIVGINPAHGATPESVEELKTMASLEPVTAFKRGAIYGVPMDDLNFGPRLGEAVTRWNGLIAPPETGNQ